MATAFSVAFSSNDFPLSCTSGISCEHRSLTAKPGPRICRISRVLCALRVATSKSIFFSCFPALLRNSLDMSSERRKPYPFHQIEPKWQAIWEERQRFHAPNPGDKNFDQSKPKFYILDMFPYPSGAGLHVGHPEGYTATDIVARYKRMRGFNVLHPMGWDAFGLPAEQYAIKTGQHPAITTRENVAKFKSQLKRIGFSYDWQREVNTTDPHYYKWTQWIFLQIYNSYFDYELKKAQPIALLEDALSEKPRRQNEWKDNAYLAATHDASAEMSAEDRACFIGRSRLAYVAEVPVNWCPELGTVLANEEVIDGKSEIGGFPVVR